MLEPNEPTHTQNTIEEPDVQSSPRRRRAASRAAGPPSSAPDAPTIEHAPELGVASAADKPAKKTAAKRTAKKATAEPSSGGDAPAKTTRKRAAKKVAADPTDAPVTAEFQTGPAENGPS